MKKNLLILFLLFTSNLLLAQQQGQAIYVTGKVITADGESAPGLIITIKNSKTIAFTQDNGSFKLAVPSGKSQLIIKSVINNFEQTIEINSAVNIELPTIKLKESAYELKEVVVTGEYEAQSLKNSVQRVRTISNEKIVLRGATTVLEALSTELGVRFSNDLTLGETDVQLMGMAGQNVKILLDGVPVIDRSGTKQSLSQIDINTVDRIEIVEGPLSVVYGTDALAGVINIITKKGNGRENLSISAKFQEETVGKEYSGFSNDGVHMENMTANYAKKGWEFGLGATRNNNGGWQGALVGRTKQWRPKDQNLANGKFGYRNSNLYVWYRLDFLDEDISALGDINPNTNKTTDAIYTTTRFTHQAQADWQINPKLSLNSAASYQDYKRETQTTDVDFNTGKTTLNLNPGTQDVSGFKTSFLRSTLQYKLSNTISFQPGFDIKLDEASGQRILNSPSINDYSAFLTSEINFNLTGFAKQLTIKPGVRMSVNSVYDAPPFIPSLNTKLVLNHDIAVRLAYARGFRSPALRELYFTFHDASHDIEGNPNLKAEYSNSFTGSVSWQSINTSNVRLNSVVAGFYNDFKNRISIATGIDPANPQWNIYVNIDRYKTTGGTFENQLNWKNLELGVGLSLIGRYNSYSEVLSELSTFMWTPELNSNLVYKFNKIGLNTTLAYKFSGKRPGYEMIGTALHETEIGAFHWADLGLSKRINHYITLNGGVKNLFDVSTIKNNSQDLGGAHSTGGAIPMGYGRSYFLGLTMQWTKN